MAKKSYLVDEQLPFLAGINPKTGKPLRLDNGEELKKRIKCVLNIVDEQNAVNRYIWYNLPEGITSQELERMIYYKGQLCFFLMNKEKFYFMPYALDGTIDFYGRFNSIHPVPFTSGVAENEKGEKERLAAQTAYLGQMKLKCQYDLVPEELVDEELMTKSCVLLHDYTKQLSQMIIPRRDVNAGIIDVESECIPLLETSLIAGSGIKGMRVDTADAAESVTAASRSIKHSALSQQLYIPVRGDIDFQDLTDGTVTKAQDYLLAMESLDNFRLSSLGLENGGLFEKKQHILESEAQMQGGQVSLVLQDGLNIRQHFCEVVNSIWGLGIWCEISEDAGGMDMNGDGINYDTNTTQNLAEGDDDNASEI